MAIKIPIVNYLGVLKQLQAGDSISVGAVVATDSIWTSKGDTVAATGSSAATITSVGADGTNYQANSANANGVGWAQVAQSCKIITASFTMFANNCAFISNRLTLNTGVRITMQTNSRIVII